MSNGRRAGPLKIPRPDAYLREAAAYDSVAAWRECARLTDLLVVQVDARLSLGSIAPVGEPRRVLAAQVRMFEEAPAHVAVAGCSGYVVDGPER